MCQQRGNYALPSMSCWYPGIASQHRFSLWVFFAPGAEKGSGTLFNVTWEISCSAVAWCSGSLMIQKWEKWLGRQKNSTDKTFFPVDIPIHSYFVLSPDFFLFNFLKWFWHIVTLAEAWSRGWGKVWYSHFTVAISPPGQYFWILFCAEISEASKDSIKSSQDV